MDDHRRRVLDAASHLDVAWEGQHVDGILGRLHERRKRRAWARGAAAASVILLSAWVGALTVSEGPPMDVPAPTMSSMEQDPVAAVAPEPEPVRNVLQFADGSRVVLLRPDSRLLSLVSERDRVAVEFAQGEARFEVPEKSGRVFSVTVEMHTFQVSGARFELHRNESEVSISVLEGEVRLDDRALQTGTSTSLPLVRVEKTPPEVPPSRAKPVPAPWRRLAEDGDFDEAYQALQNAAEPRNEAKDLMLAADVARLSGHPEDAVQPLTRVVEEHSTHAVAPLAAFTLGRVYLRQLGMPTEAAAAFARARQLDARGALAEDALAREVEAWSQAGDGGRAKERAQEYVGRYPFGRRIDAVRRHGGLD